ncbi:TPA: GIY-YIG nuclease family protein [Citrobacter koseri]|uniref:GIY-YIG nuclease family protein n=1 Tax=Citrobacter koseri TaxID=545 RepID=UPI000D955A25|nr:GIY-YIG nuclease family protein [Citrobacter koseri]SQB62384.1 T5orf172 domain [Citrobacter koseri]
MLEKMEASYVGYAGFINSKKAPKTNKFERGYIYVLKLSNGYTKVGSTAEPASRIKSLQRGLRSTEVTLDHLWLSVSHINYKDNEKQVLAYLEGKERDGEFFKIPFDEALSVVMGMKIKKSFTAEEIEEKEAKNAEFRNWLDDIHGFSRQQQN